MVASWQGWSPLLLTPGVHQKRGVDVQMWTTRSITYNREGGVIKAQEIKNPLDQRNSSNRLVAQLGSG